ncbi:MAG: hypothetical protein A2W91_13785 [Bacteroidetes bacterium GWF2_38_335]|nr:MAG: hypothetical protein A2W91_13785 [Bacteroidetes bacterium GWF2_38_335]OFY77849.1 MAG: hypothetical protein A2281_15475 [Bacteroidetes bacterium RIFOXYA12_FULL_38_20]
MAKKESNLLNMVLSLFIVSAVAAAALGFVYESTKGPIEEAKQKFLNEQIGVVVPGAAEAEVSEPIEKDGLTIYIVKKDGKVIGTAIKSFTDAGFSGHFEIIVGFDNDGKIIDSNVLTHHETPGLGDKMQKSVSPWNDQFKGKDPATFSLIVKKDGGMVDAITAATISSRGYCDALSKAYSAFMNLKNEGGIE